MQTNSTETFDGQLRVVILFVNKYFDIDQYVDINSSGYTHVYDRFNAVIGRRYEYQETFMSYPINPPAGRTPVNNVSLAISIRADIDVEGFNREVEISNYAYRHFANEIKPILF